MPLGHGGRQGRSANKIPRVVFTVDIELKSQMTKYCLLLEYPSVVVLQEAHRPYHISVLPLIQYRHYTHRAEFKSLSECSLNFRMSGKAPFCLPACIVTSFSFPVYDPCQCWVLCGTNY
jgi:hypothetical protein